MVFQNPENIINAFSCAFFDPFRSNRYYVMRCYISHILLYIYQFLYSLHH